MFDFERLHRHAMPSRSTKSLLWFLIASLWFGATPAAVAKHKVFSAFAALNPSLLLGLKAMNGGLAS